MPKRKAWMRGRSLVVVLLLALLMPAARGVLAQSDPLVSKSLPLILSDGEFAWAFADDGLNYSRIDVFGATADIRNGKLPFQGGIRDGLGRDSSVLLFFNHVASDSDSVVTAGLSSLDRNQNVAADSLLFARSGGKPAKVGLSALAIFRDRLILGAGRAGFAVTGIKPEGQRPLAGDTLSFWTLRSGNDTAANLFRCVPGVNCRVDTLDSVNPGASDSNAVNALAVDSAAPDTSWLLIATPTGLRRGLLGGNFFPKVALPDPAGDKLAIQSLHVDSRNRLLWVFSSAKFFFSDDHGLTFRTVPDVAGLTAQPSSFMGRSLFTPEAVGTGDSTYVNFNMDRPGLVLFRRDTVLSNLGGGANDTLGDVILDSEDGLFLTGRLSDLAWVNRNGVSALIAGSAIEGLFYRKFGPGEDGSWVNVNRLRDLKRGLEEVITFPTVFPDDRGSEYIRIGYRLKKDGRVTLTVYNYAMEKVRTLVKNQLRRGGGARSENAAEDRWDGRDASGRSVSVGLYYILVESDQGEKGWGKAVVVRGRGR